MEHLDSSTAKWLDKPTAVRIKAIWAEKWVPYTVSEHVTRYMTLLQMYAESVNADYCPDRPRLQNLLLVGETGNGKTRLLSRYANQYGPHLQSQRQPGQRPECWPVLYVEAPVVPDERRLYHEILMALGVPFAEKAGTDAKKDLVDALLKDLHVRLLIVDEIQQMLGGTAAKQREALTVLKTLSNRIRIPLVFAGIQSARNVLLHDAQMHSRFDELILPRWTMTKEYQRLLASLERLFPLRKPSYLADEALAYKLLSLSRGTIGGLVKYLKSLAVHAVLSGQECISLDQIQQLEAIPIALWFPAGAGDLSI